MRLLPMRQSRARPSLHELCPTIPHACREFIEVVSAMVIRSFKWMLFISALLLSSFAKAGAQRLPAASSAAGYTQAEEMVRAHQWDAGLNLLLPLLKSYPRDIKVLNLTGLAFTGKGDLKLANTYFRRALQLDPGFVPALKNLGINEFTLHDFASSEKHLDLAIKRAPGDPVANLYMGEIDYMRQNFKGAAERLQQASGFLSRDADLKAQLAVSLLRTGRSAAALHMLDDLQPQDISAFSQFAVGVNLAQSGQPSRAIPYFELIRQHYPKSYNAAFNLVLCYIGALKPSEAISLANQLITGGHDTDEVEDALAEAYEQMHDTKLAVAALRRAIALNPKDEDNYLDFANMCIDHRDLENGLRVIGVGLQASPNSYRLVFERGILYAMEDRFDLAEKDFQESANLAPASDFGYVGMGVTYLEAGNSSKAIALLQQRLKQSPNDASLLYLLGEALMRNGARLGEPQYAEAQSVFEKSIRLNPGLCLPHVALGAIYISEDRFKDAIVQLEQARAIDPKEKSAYWHLAVAYRRSGDTADAKRILGILQNIDQQNHGWMHNRVKPEDGSSNAQAAQQ